MFWMVLPAKKVLVIGASSLDEMLREEITSVNDIEATKVVSEKLTDWEDVGGPMGLNYLDKPTFGVGARMVDEKLTYHATYTYSGKEDWREVVKRNGKVEFALNPSGK